MCFHLRTGMCADYGSTRSSTRRQRSSALHLNHSNLFFPVSPKRKRVKRCLSEVKTNKRCLLFYSMPSLDKLELDLLFSTFLSVPFYNVSQYIGIKILKNKWFNH